MEELDELRQAIEAGDYDQALAILDALDAMSRDDMITKMMSYMRVLLIHLLKQAAEQRSTRSWEDSIAESLDRIVMLNKRRKAGGYYLDEATLGDALAETYLSALRRAAREVFEGVYTVEQLAAMVDQEALLKTALLQIQHAHAAARGDREPS
jgi:uncharacterized protein YnzC (UPF0291/DUF896 family)